MAKRGAKAAAIREHVKQHPTHKAKDVIEALASRRIKVSPNQVYAILAESNGHKPPATTAEPTPTGSVDFLFQAKALVTAAGGMNQAHTALETLAKLLA